MTEYINTATGEIVDTSTPRQRGRVASVRQYIGTDTKYPSECVTADSLLEALRNLDANLHYKPDIKYDLLTDSLTQKYLTTQEVGMLVYLSKTLAGWNYWIGNRATLAAEMGGAKIGRLLQALVDKGMLQITHTDRPFRNDLVLKVNPTVAFKGSYIFRDNCIETWYSDVFKASRTALSS